MHVAICDDDAGIVGKIEMLILEHQHVMGEEFEIDAFYSGEELLRFMERDEEEYGIILLDIEMNKLTGVDAAKIIRDVYGDKSIQIIFISSHEERWKELFAVKPFGFISKPVNEREFLSVFFKCVEEIRSENLIFTYKFKNNIEVVQVKSILYFESNGRNVILVTEHDKRTIHTTMKSILHELDEFSFVQIHKSFYVNPLHMEKLMPAQAVMSNGDELPVSKKRKGKVEQEFLNYLDLHKSKGVRMV